VLSKVVLASAAMAAFLFGPPGANAATSLPPLELTPAISRGDTQVITGRDCAGTSGLGYGFLATIQNGQSSLTGGDGYPVDGVWTYTTQSQWDGFDVPAGRYDVTASCYDNGTQGDAYPATSFLLLPSADEEIDDVLTVSAADVEAGQTIDISGAGFSTATDIGVFLLRPGTAPAFLGSTTSAEDAAGSMAVTVTIPASTASGSYSLFVQGHQSGSFSGDPLRSLAAGVTVTAAPPPSSTTTTGSATSTTTSTGPLAVTGSRHARPLTMLAFALVAVGAAFVLAGNAAARRRR
jgi:hypothetical protein